MKNTNTFIFAVLVGCLSVFNSSAWAQTEIGFDDIVEGLSRNRSSLKTPSGETSLEDVQIHTGIGITNGVFAIQNADGTNTQANQRGIQVNLGIDLFDPNFVAEGTIMSFLEHEYEKATIALQEFDLKLYYKDMLEPTLDYRLGGGLAARYLSVQTKNNGEQKYTTPAWIAIAGLDVYLTKGLSLGAEVAGRGSLTNETPDQSSMDFALRLDAHF